MEPAVLREDMVDGLASPPRNVLTDDTVAVAMGDVPRHVFVDDQRTAYAARDHDVLGTRVLSPSTAARLLQALSLDGDEKVLIVGVGVGYTAAVAAEIVGETSVHAVDISRPIVIAARENLAEAGYDGVLVDRRDGAEGFPEYAPFDRILLEAAVVEPPRALLQQLHDDGRLVFPRGTHHQRLEAIAPDGDREVFDAVSFDPLLVEGEQSGAVERNRTSREDRERATRRAESRLGWEQEWIEWDDSIESHSQSH